MHVIDNLGGKLGSFDRLEKGLQDGETWSRYDRALDGLRLVRAPAGRGAAADALRAGAARAPPASRRSSLGAAGRRTLKRAAARRRRWSRQEVRTPAGMSNARDHKLGIFLVALLAAASVRLDDIWYRRPIDAAVAGLADRRDPRLLGERGR